MVSRGALHSDGYWRMRHVLSQGEAGLKVFSPVWERGAFGGRLKSKFHTEHTKLTPRVFISPRH